MTRPHGFATMDVSTSILDDPEWRALARKYPDSYPEAVTAYLGLMRLSWRTAERATVEDGWTGPREISPETVAALRAVGLVDDELRWTQEAFDRWVGPAITNRDKLRDQRRRADAKRDRSRVRAPQPRVHGWSIHGPSMVHPPTPGRDGSGRDGEGRDGTGRVVEGEYA